MKSHLKMNLDAKKITILVFVINVMYFYTFMPTADALFISDDKVNITMDLNEGTTIHKSLKQYLTETQVSINKIEVAPNEKAPHIIDYLASQVKKGQNIGLIITKMDYTQELIDKNLIRPIPSAYANSVLQNINPTFNDASLSYKGEVFTLPVSRTTPLMFYNINAIRKSSCELENFTEADIPKTWMEFVKLLERCQDNSNLKSPLLLGGQSFDWIFQSMVAQQGGSLIDANHKPDLTNPKVVKTLEMWQNLQAKNLIKIEKYWEKAINIFSRGDSPIVCFSTDGITEVLKNKTTEFTWGVGHLPTQANAKVALGGFNIYFGINMTTAEIESSKEIIKLLYDNGVQKKIFETGCWPVIKNMIENEENGEAFKIAAKQLNHLSDSRYSTRQSDMIEALQTAIMSALYDGTSPQKALQIAQDAIENK